MCRNFPAVKDALTEAGLHIEGGPQVWELTTQKLVGDDGKQFLSAVSILTVPNLAFRQKALQVCNQVRPRCRTQQKACSSGWDEGTL